MNIYDVNIIGTLVFSPIYLGLRWPYFKLPVGPDTGYYVSNHTIAHRKFSFWKGWNARYAMRSKFLPEMFLSMVYLRLGPKKYPIAWRATFSVYNYLTAIAVGLLVDLTAGHAPFSYLAGLPIYGLISSEPDYGIYYESAEQFEILFQTAGTYLVLRGLLAEDPFSVLLGTGLWIFDVFFVKLTAVVAAAPILAGVLWYLPGLAPYLGAESLIG
jgi:hypothetical protein